MLFKDSQFKDKNLVLKTRRYNITNKAIKILAENNISVYKTALNRYITILIEETDYNIRDNVFYEKISGFKFTDDIFAQITVEYVMEHLNEFTQ